MRDRLIDVFTHLDEHISYKEEYGVLFDTPFVKAVEDVLQMLKGLTVQEWISVKDRLPETETEVLILAVCGKRHIITTGMYEDGTKSTEDSKWWWQETDWFEYDEELDAYIIPEGWWEYKHYNGDDEYNHAIDDKVTHWMPLPSAPKGE